MLHARRPWQSILITPLFLSFAGALFVSGAAAATIDVSTYGALPGNSSADAAAINNAIQDAKPGDVVVIPAGNYPLNTSIMPKSGVTISGAGQGKTTLSYVGSTASPVIAFRSLSANVSISDLTIDGNNNANATSGVSASHNTGIALTNLGFTNFVNTGSFGPFGVYFSAAVTNSSVANCSFSNIGVGTTFGGAIRFSNGSSYNQAIGNVIANTGRGGIFGDNGSGNAPSTNLVIQNNTITGSGGTGLAIEIQGCPNSIIQNNQVDHWISVDSSSNSAVRSNVVSDNSGIYKFAGLELVNSNDVVMTGNTVNDGAQIGISESNNGATQSIARTFIAHNIIKSASTWGVQVQGGVGGITQQYFFDNTIQDTAAAGPNTMNAPQGNGFRVNGNTQNLVLDSNTITHNGGAGLQPGGANVNNLAVINNTITNNAGLAVTSPASGISNIQWTNNTLYGNASNNGLATTPSAPGNPTMSLDAPKTVATGATVNFAANFQSPDAPLAAVLWDFGDGLPLAADSSDASYVFSTAGEYTVAVVGWDANGNAALAQTTIDVVTVPEPVAAGIMLLGVGLIVTRRNRSKTEMRAA